MRLWLTASPEPEVCVHRKKESRGGWLDREFQWQEEHELLDEKLLRCGEKPVLEG